MANPAEQIAQLQAQVAVLQSEVAALQASDITLRRDRAEVARQMTIHLATHRCLALPPTTTCANCGSELPAVQEDADPSV